VFTVSYNIRLVALPPQDFNTYEGEIALSAGLA